MRHACKCGRHTPCLGRPGTTAATHCVMCREEGMVDARHARCQISFKNNCCEVNKKRARTRPRRGAPRAPRGGAASTSPCRTSPHRAPSPGRMTTKGALRPAQPPTSRCWQCHGRTCTCAPSCSRPVCPILRTRGVDRPPPECDVNSEVNSSSWQGWRCKRL